MVSKSHARRRQDIKTKLMAAIAMLLVSSIMMVSSTYAWFTLSTAPEVTGINTQVGANGNLEMALMPMNGLGTEGFGITSSVGDSIIAENYKKNITWGNLVNLDDDFYGLDQITLYPAKLALQGDLIAGWWLETPSYGADGRVAALEKNATTSAFNSDPGVQNFSGGKMTLDNTEYNLATAMGVRAVGNASGMSDREIALRNARSSAANAMSGAKVAASSSLNANGVALANIAIKHGTDSEAKHSQAEVTALLGIVNALIGADGNSGIIGTIESAYLNYIVAYAASSESGLSDDQYKAFQGTIAEKSLSEVVTLLGTGGTFGEVTWGAITLPDKFGTKIADLAATKKNVVDAKAALEALRVEGTPNDDIVENIEWSAISVPLYMLCKTEALTINDKYNVGNIKQDISGVMSSYADQGLNISIGTGGGVYADIADHCGNYNAAIVIDKISYGSGAGAITVPNVKANMKTASTVKPAHLETLGSYAAGLSAPEAGENTEKPITDTYGYIIDLAFRTNAAESNLLLQTDATGRIYDGANSTEDTMGHGSTMTFTTTAVGFTAEQMKGLMECINLVFFDPADGNRVLATAKLDVATATVTGGNTVTAKLYLYEYAEESYAAATTFENGKTYYTLADGVYTEATGITEFAENTTYYTKVAAGYKKLTGNDAVITALTQGVAKAVSVLVYLDGETITNADVAATAAMSMTGTLNLQFASSATLVPMEYTPLMNQTGTGTETEPENGTENGTGTGN